MDIPIKAVEEAAKVLPEVYKDAAQPAVREVGSVLRRAVRMVLAPVRGLVWSWEHAEAWLEESVEKRFERRGVSPADIVTPSPQLTAGVIRGLQAAGPEPDPTLREAFANLLATAMERDRADNVHPAFAEILSNITPDEARILLQLARRLPQPLIGSIQVAVVSGLFSTHVGGDVDFEVLRNELEMARPILLASYLDNLERLGLIMRRSENFEARPAPVVAREEQERRHYFLAYLRAYGVAAAHEGRELFLRTSREAPWKATNQNRASINLELIWATAFGEQLLRATADPNEVETLSRISDEDMAAAARADSDAIARQE